MHVPCRSYNQSRFGRRDPAHLRSWENAEWELTRSTVVVPYPTPAALVAGAAPGSLEAWRRRATSVFFHTRRGNPPLAHGSQALLFAI